MSNKKLDRNHDFGYSIALFSTKYSTWLFPLTITVTILPLFIIAYLSAVLHNQVPIFMPFISECVTRYPQAGYFTLYAIWICFICKFNNN